MAAPDHRPELKFLQLYVDEAGALIARGEFELNHDLWKFAQVLPSIPETYRCCACANVFAEHPGAAVQCPACGQLYAQVVILTAAAVPP